MRLNENPELQSDDDIAVVLEGVRESLARCLPGFDPAYLDARTTVLKAKERLKSEKKMLAVNDPARWSH